MLDLQLATLWTDQTSVLFYHRECDQTRSLTRVRWGDGEWEDRGYVCQECDDVRVNQRIAGRGGFHFKG